MRPFAILLRTLVSARRWTVFATKSSLSIPQYLRRDDTLPCKIIWHRFWLSVASARFSASPCARTLILYYFYKSHITSWVRHKTRHWQDFSLDIGNGLRAVAGATSQQPTTINKWLSVRSSGTCDPARMRTQHFRPHPLPSSSSSKIYLISRPLSIVRGSQCTIGLVVGHYDT